MSTPAGEEPKPVIFLAEIKSPPFTGIGRIEAGSRLRDLQEGAMLPFPISRPMPTIGRRVHELRIRDAEHNWRIFYRIDDDAIVVALIFAKKTGKTPKHVIDECRARLSRYDDL